MGRIPNRGDGPSIAKVMAHFGAQEIFYTTRNQLIAHPLQMRGVSSSREREVFSTHTMPLSDIADVDIDPSGTFKYILIQCSDKSKNDQKFIVRGYSKCEYHDDIFKLARNDAGDAFNLKCVGGGKIKHENDKKRILVYGESQGFGQADHSKTVDILKKRYPDYQITSSSEEH
ncbi:hypothetical protein KIN20_035548 [Parelaphostrongylus tenuis]|uniref:Sex-regulated protein janus-B n=1 Tax=Parelaphostrongylus tenuis TaxID=148309 RepID=A0AAD5RBP0_PARTN|nr:hypothetical protein KIN20_035548 [Parelaphostrongylus tenuis]